MRCKNSCSVIAGFLLSGASAIAFAEAGYNDAGTLKALAKAKSFAAAAEEPVYDSLTTELPDGLIGLSSTNRFSSTVQAVVYTINAATGAATPVVTTNGIASFAGLSFLGGVLHGSDLSSYPGALSTFDVGSIDPSGMITSVSDQNGSLNWHGLASGEAEGRLWSIDLDNGNQLTEQLPDGTVNVIGPTGIEGRGMAYDDGNGILYATGSNVPDYVQSLYTVDTATGASTLIGSTGIDSIYVGLAFDECSDTLYMVATPRDEAVQGGPSSLYTLDTTTGAATLVGATGFDTIDGLAWKGDCGPCAILADTLVTLRGGSTVQGAVCSNGDLRTNAKVVVDPPTDTDLQALLQALGDIRLGSNTQVANSAFTNGDLSLATQSEIGLDAHAGNTLKLAGRSRVLGTCYYGDGIDLSRWAECGMQDTPSTLLPLVPFELPVCAVVPPQPGAPDINTRAGSDAYYVTPLAPGDYGDVSFGPGNKVAILGGDYHFQSLSFGAKTEVELRGEVTLHVVERLRFAGGVNETLVDVEPNEIVYLVNGDASTGPTHRAAANTELFGTICGPHSSIILGSGSSLTGGLIGNKVSLGAKTTFKADPAPVQ